LNLISNLFKNKREHSLVIEEIGNHFEVTYARIDAAGKEIFIRKRKKTKNLNRLKKPFFLLDKLVLALGSSRATTIESSVYLRRSKPNEIINEAELDHMIFRGLWEFLNHYRSWAAKKMSVADIDLVLANIEIKDVGLGTHRVFNPLGFKGPDFFLRLRGTFVPRAMLETINRFQSWTKYLAVVEDAGIVSATIPEPVDLAVHSDNAKTVVFSLAEAERLYLKEIPWGLMNIITAVSRIFGSDEETARLILNQYLEGRVSKRFDRLIRGAVNKEFKALLGHLASIYNKAKRKSRPNIHFNFRFTIKPPLLLFGGSKMKLMNFVKWLELQGYSIETGHGDAFNQKTQQNTLALLMHVYQYPHYDFLNQMLRRRAKWLIANP